MGKFYGYHIDARELEDVREICVLCWGLLGDVLLRVPVIEALRQRFPAARITAVVDPVGEQVLRHHPDVAECCIFSRSKKPLWRYVAGFVRHVSALRRRRFDLCVNLYSGGSSPLITRLIGARIRLGFDHTPALRKANNLLVKYPGFCGHWTRALGTKLEPLGVTVDQIRRGSSFYCTQQARAWASTELPGNRTQVAINLGAGVEAKRWPVANFLQLANRIREQHGLSIVVFTNPGMEQLAAEFAALDAAGQHRVLPLLPLDRVAAVLERCRAVITGDTSIMHLAFGVKCPSLVLFTHTRPEHVEPEDCAHVACFLADESNLDDCGKPLGRRDIPLALVERKFAELLEKTA